MNNRTLSWEELMRQGMDEHIAFHNLGKAITHLAIRTEEGIDFGVAAIHREGDHLIIDMGHALEEVP